MLSKNTFDHPCPKCGVKIVKEAYMGGAVYYCPNCQKL
ncbi:zf-TFIIB domain-containing protein [Cecembia calidifontis]